MRAAIAANPKTPHGILESLTKDSSWNVRKALLARNNISSKIVSQLAHHYIVPARAFTRQFLLTRNAFLPVEALMQYKKSPSNRVRREIAKHANATTKLLKTLSSDRCTCVRKAVAKNSNTPVNILQKLAKDRQKSVRVLVVQNPSLPKNEKIKFLEDSSPYVRTFAEIHCRKKSRRDYQLAKDPKTCAKTLEALAQKNLPHLCRLVVKHPNTPIKTLVGEHGFRYRKDFLQNPKIIRFFIEKNPALLQMTARFFANLISYWTRPEKFVIKWGVSHSNWKFRRVLAKAWLSAEQLEILSKDPHEEVRAAVANNFSASKLMLEKLAKDPSDLVRYIVAKKGYTPYKTREELCDDQSPWVAKTARRYLKSYYGNKLAIILRINKSTKTKSF